MADVFAGTQSLDSVPPTVSNRFPAPDTVGNLVTQPVTFDVIDDPGGSGVDSATVNVTIEGLNAIVGGVVQAGYTGTLTPVTDGFAVSIIPDSGLPQNSTIDVVIDASDGAVPANVMTTVSYSFDTEVGDNTAPSVENQIPAPASTLAQFDGAIEFDIVDRIGTGSFFTGVDENHITVTVDAVPAITSGVFQAGFTGTITDLLFGGKRVRIVPDADLPCDASVAVTVDARDLANPHNQMTTVNYSFTVEPADNVAPVVQNRHPQPSATEVPLAQPITFDLLDLLSTGSRINGLIAENFDVRINGADAILGGVVQAGYTGTVTATDDGFEVSIAPTGGWTLDQAVTVEVDAQDGKTLIFSEGFEEDWDDLPPNPQFDPPDLSFTEQFDASWDGVP